MHKLGVLASGRGTNFQAIIDACKESKIPDTEVAVLVTDNPEAYAIERAKNDGIPFKVVLKKDFDKRWKFDMAVSDILEEHGVELVCLAGFMRILSKKFVRKWYGKCINIHPALLPSFPGLEGQNQAWEHGAKVSGCTVHYVDEGCDTGPVIVQRAVIVDEGCNVDELAAKILKEEHIAYSEARRLHLEGKLKIDGRRVIVG